ncbi:MULTISPECIES: hypothetical protein [unclassified Bacillus (in: firmicutes)]|uniref:hypothetical protein n=1 Tax=unclassified Bacillus (in: firmicutes) TaxID=185979 RepID=UPI0038397569
MFYLTLANINQSKNLEIQEQQLKVLNECLTILREDESISPYFLSRKSKLPVGTIIRLLNCMVSRSILKTNFILRCNNSDTDLVDAFEFEDEDELLEFLRENDYCPDCGSTLMTRDIRVFYKINTKMTGDADE